MKRYGFLCFLMLFLCGGCNFSTYFYKSKRKEASPYNIKEILEVNKKYRELLNKVLYE
jgi:hypothetical protein